MLVCLFGALGYTWSKTPVYSASSEVFVSFASAESTSELTAGATYIQRQVATYVSLVGTERVLEPVIDELGLGTTPAALRQHVSATSPADTVLIRVTARDANPLLAAQISEAVAASLAREVSALETPEGAPASTVRLELVRNADIPTQPSEPNLRLNALLAVVFGLIVGAGLVALREVTDTRVHGDHDVESLTDSPVIGRIVLDGCAEDSPLVVQSSPYHTRSEAFRRLRTNLQFVDLDGGAQVFVVTSSVPNEGKTTSAINLAITIADAGSRVLLVDADLRRPTVGKYLGIEQSVGLTSTLIHRASWRDVIQPWGSAGLFILPSGPIPPNPAEIVGSRAMTKLIEEAREEFDCVIIDTPPLLPVTDAALIAKMASGALLVAACGHVRRDELRQSLGNLEAVNARVLGVVLNRVPSDADGYGGTYGYYEYRPREEGSPARRGLGAVARRLRGRRPSEASGATDPDGPVPVVQNLPPRHRTPKVRPTWDKVQQPEPADDEAVTR